jgi:hypothetical protein
VRAILSVFAVGSFVTVCVACGDSEAGVSEKTETGGRASSPNTGGGNSDAGGTAPAGGTATGGKATGGTVPATFGGFESTGGRSASGGSRPTASGGSGPAASGGSSPNPTGGASSAECEPLPTPEATVYEGDFEIANAGDAEEAGKYSEFTGNLTIGVRELELPMLARIGGDLSSVGTTAIRLPALTQVGGRVYYYLDAAIEVLDLRSLQGVGGEFYLHRNLSLVELQVDALVEAGGGSQISANLNLPDCFLDVVDMHLDVLHTVAPEGCTCTRSCGVVTAECE